MRGDWPFSGRQAQLHQLQVWLAEHGCSGVVVAGDTGVGKTRLATEFLRCAERAGWATATVRATRSSAALPFGALAPLLPSAATPDAFVDDRAELLRRAAVELADRAVGRGLVLFVDDAHLLDDASATLVYQLAATGGAFIFVTVRSAPPAPDAVTALWKEGLAQRLELAGLGDETIGELLAAALGGPVDPATVANLSRRCQGNVLFLRELVQGALRDGTLREQDGLWAAAGPSPPSSRLAELVQTRLTDLDDAERRLLELVALAEPLGAAELFALSDARVAGALERRELVVSRVDGRRLKLWVAHPVYGEVVRAGMSSLAARQMARSLAEAVEATGARRRDDVLRLGTWRLDGGGGPPAVMLAAATTARWRFDFALSERLARAATEAGAGFDAALLAAECLALQGQSAEADEALRRLAEVAVDDDQRGRVALSRLDNDAFFIGRIDDALAVAEAAEAALSDRTWRDALAARRSALLLATSGPRAAAEVALPLVHASEGRALAWSRVVASYSLGRLGRLQEAAEIARAGAAAGRDDPQRWYHVFLLCDALALAGSLDEADALAAREHERAVDEGSAEAQAYFAWQQAKTVGERGHVATAIPMACEAVALFRRFERRTTLADALTHLALAYALAGRPQDAATVLAEIDATGRPAAFWTAVDLAQARAWTAVAAGDLPAARKFFDDAAVTGEAVGDVVGAVSALHGLARTGRASEVEPRVARLASDIEGDLAAARVRHIRGLVRADPSDLEATADEFESMGAHLLAAEAASDAATAWRAQHASRAAAAAERRAAVAAARCSGVHTPALRQSERSAGLTPAEHEAALLAAAGRSNRQIAEALYLSVRTVEGRLQRVYEKLGVSGRRELLKTMGRTVEGGPDGR